MLNAHKLQTREWTRETSRIGTNRFDDSAANQNSERNEFPVICVAVRVRTRMLRDTRHWPTSDPRFRIYPLFSVYPRFTWCDYVERRWIKNSRVIFMAQSLLFYCPRSTALRWDIKQKMMCLRVDHLSSFQVRAFRFQLHCRKASSEMLQRMAAVPVTHISLSIFSSSAILAFNANTTPCHGPQCLLLLCWGRRSRTKSCSQKLIRKMDLFFTRPRAYYKITINAFCGTAHYRFGTERRAVNV